MKVAIVGAGLSGLCCAYELEKNGIKPVIFEKKYAIGDVLEYTICTLSNFNEFRGSVMRYFKKNYDIKITPINPLNKLVMKSNNKKTVIKGNMGHVFIRGTDKESLDKQIAGYFKPNIIFDTYVDTLDIKDEFDYVVCASGELSTAKKLSICKPTLNTYTRISNVLGDFDPNTLIMWFDNECIKNGYGYLLPYNRKRASLVLALNEITHEEIEYYWDIFQQKQNFKYNITINKDVEHDMGFIDPVKIGNILLVGNAAGFIDSFMGFGTISAIESGILAARSIIYNLDYNELMKPVKEYIKLKHEYRIMINRMDNKDFDRVLTFLNMPFIKQMLYKNPFYRASYGAYIIKVFNKIMEDKNKNIVP